MLVTLTFSLRRVMMPMRPMFPTSPRTIVMLYHTTRNPVMTGDIWHCSSCPRTKSADSLPGCCCTDPWPVRECVELELFKDRDRAVADWFVLVSPLKDISPGLQCQQPPGSNSPFQPCENMHLKQREETHRERQRKIHYSLAGLQRSCSCRSDMYILIEALNEAKFILRLWRKGKMQLVRTSYSLL